VQDGASLERQATYPAHKGAIKCLASAAGLLASGGADDLIHLYDVPVRLPAWSMVWRAMGIMAVDAPHSQHVRAAMRMSLCALSCPSDPSTVALRHSQFQMLCSAGGTWVSS